MGWDLLFWFLISFAVIYDIWVGSPDNDDVKKWWDKN